MDHEFWYLSRAAGFTAYLLLFASTVVGMGTSSRLAARLKRANMAFDLHRFLSLLALAFSLFHAYVLLGDAYFNFSVWQLSVPFASPYEPFATALGVASLYATVLIIGSFYVRRFIGYRTWRTLHYATFVMYLGVALHGITAGTDTVQPWARLIYAGTAAVFCAMAAYRIHEAGGGTQRDTRRGRISLDRAA